MLAVRADVDVVALHVLVFEVGNRPQDGFLVPGLDKHALGLGVENADLEHVTAHCLDLPRDGFGGDVSSLHCSSHCLLVYDGV